MPVPRALSDKLNIGHHTTLLKIVSDSQGILPGERHSTWTDNVGVAVQEISLPAGGSTRSVSGEPLQSGPSPRPQQKFPRSTGLIQKVDTYSRVIMSYV